MPTLPTGFLASFTHCGKGGTYKAASRCLGWLRPRPYLGDAVLRALGLLGAGTLSVMLRHLKVASVVRPTITYNLCGEV